MADIAAAMAPAEGQATAADLANFASGGGGEGMMFEEVGVQSATRHAGLHPPGVCGHGQPQTRFALEFASPSSVIRSA